MSTLEGHAHPSAVGRKPVEITITVVEPTTEPDWADNAMVPVVIRAAD